MGSVGFDPGFVEENEAVRIEADVPERVEFFAGGDDIGPLLLGGDERFFLNEISKARKAFPMVVRSQVTPNVARKPSSVRLGFAATASRAVRLRGGGNKARGG